MSEGMWGSNAVRWRGTISSFLSPFSSLGLCLLLACDPGTTRPDLVPLPESRTIEVVLGRRAALETLHRTLVADSIPLARVDTIDLWLDTPWFDAVTLRPTGAGTGPQVVKLRGWSEPSRPGHSLLVVELVFRPLVDPSVPARALERPVAPGDSIYARIGRTLKTIQDEFGAHQ